MGLLAIHLKHPDVTREHLGLIPYMLNPDDPRPAREQFDEEYQHGGGWKPFKGHTLRSNNSLEYPEDQPLIPIAEIQFRDELVVIYDFGWVAIIQKDRSFEVCRMD